MPKYQHVWHNGTPIDLATGKAVCIGKNYADHIKEMDAVFKDAAAPDSKNKQPVLFLKPSAALCDANDDIQISHLAHFGEIHHELEIALLIGKPLNSKSKNCLEAIIGIGLAIDLTLRDVQTDLKKRGLPWERAKSFDRSCPVSGFMPFSSGDKDLDLNGLSLEFVVNEKVRQTSNSAMMLTPIEPMLIEMLTLFSLEPGDIVLTGTPAGVAPLNPGDVIKATLNGQTLIGAHNVT